VYSTIPAFWLMIHPFAERWRGRQRSPYRTVIPLWILMWVIMAVATFPWRTVLLYSHGLAWVVSGLLFITGIELYIRSRVEFSPAQLGGVPEIRASHPDQRLVTSGIRSRVRHPVYVAHLCEMLAWSIGTGLAVCFGLTGFAIITGGVMIRLEEAELEKRFGEPYRQYRERVPAIVPRLR
jgi:protein-S-isoprenylcysteine O-methyltransferase Ste14